MDTQQHATEQPRPLLTAVCFVLFVATLLEVSGWPVCDHALRWCSMTPRFFEQA